MKRYYAYDIKEAYTFTELDDSDFYEMHVFRVDGSEDIKYIHKDLVKTLLDNNRIMPLELED